MVAQERLWSTTGYYGTGVPLTWPYFSHSNNLFADRSPNRCHDTNRKSVTLPKIGIEGPLILVPGFSQKKRYYVAGWNKHFKVSYASDRLCRLL